MSLGLLFGILYWGALLIWSAVVTYVILFVFFPEKIHHHATHEDSNAPKFARHRFQKLPGSEALTVNDIVTALSHSKPIDTVEAAPETPDALPEEETPGDTEEETKNSEAH